MREERLPPGDDPESNAAVEFRAQQIAGGTENPVLLNNIKAQIWLNPKEVDDARRSYAAYLRKKVKSRLSGERGGGCAL